MTAHVKIADACDAINRIKLEDTGQTPPSPTAASRPRPSGQILDLAAAPTKLSLNPGLTLIAVTHGAADSLVPARSGFKSRYISPVSVVVLASSARRQVTLELDRPARAKLLFLPAGDVSEGLRGDCLDSIAEQSPCLRDRFIFETCVRLVRELTSNGENDPAWQRHAPMLLLTAVRQGVQDLAQTPPRRQSPAVPFRRIIEWIEDNMGENLTVGRMADEAGMPGFAFSRRFKSRFGITPQRYLIERRLAKAESLLTETNMSIADIAYAVGFSSQSHFTTTFGTELGMPPGQYRLSGQQTESAGQA